MGTQNLSRIFNPASIAVIGAGDEQTRVGHTLIRNIIGGGFKGAVYPVDPNPFPNYESACCKNAGGPGIMAVDALSSFGHDPAVLSVQTIEALEETLEKAWSKTNPVDVLADASCAQKGWNLCLG